MTKSLQIFAFGKMSVLHMKPAPLRLIVSERKRAKIMKKKTLLRYTTLRQRNLKTAVSFFTLKTHRMFSVHTAPEKFENASIGGHLRFAFEENSGGEIT